MKTCLECKYFYEVDATQTAEIYHRCKHPKLTHPDPVLGDVVKSVPAAEVRDDVNRCGPEGQWFEGRA